MDESILKSYMEGEDDKAEADSSQSDSEEDHEEQVPSGPLPKPLDSVQETTSAEPQPADKAQASPKATKQPEDPAADQEPPEPWHMVQTLPDSILSNSPSSKDGVIWENEYKFRVWGCELIQEAGILLRLPQVVMATGQNLLQRFFYRRSLKRFDAFTVAMGCLFLSCKVEEKPKRLREILFVFHHIYQMRKGLKYTPLELGGQQYMQWKSELIKMERHALKELGFSFYNIMDHPHKFILYYIKALDGSNELAQTSWNYVNDSLRTDFCLRYRSEVIACAAIYMAARVLQVSLPNSPPWWELFGARLMDMSIICNGILALYKMEHIKWLEPLNESSTFKRGSQKWDEDQEETSTKKEKQSKKSESSVKSEKQDGDKETDRSSRRSERDKERRDRDSKKLERRDSRRDRDKESSKDSRREEGRRSGDSSRRDRRAKDDREDRRAKDEREDRRAKDAEREERKAKEDLKQREKSTESTQPVVFSRGQRCWYHNSRGGMEEVRVVKVQPNENGNISQIVYTIQNRQGREKQTFGMKLSLDPPEHEKEKIRARKERLAAWKAKSSGASADAVLPSYRKEHRHKDHADGRGKDADGVNRPRDAREKALESRARKRALPQDSSSESSSSSDDDSSSSSDEEEHKSRGPPSDSDASRSSSREMARHARHRRERRRREQREDRIPGRGDRTRRRDRGGDGSLERGRDRDRDRERERLSRKRQAEDPISRGRVSDSGSDGQERPPKARKAAKPLNGLAEESSVVTAMDVEEGPPEAPGSSDGESPTQSATAGRIKRNYRSKRASSSSSANSSGSDSTPERRARDRIRDRPSQRDVRGRGRQRSDRYRDERSRDRERNRR